MGAKLIKNLFLTLVIISLIIPQVITSTASNQVLAEEGIVIATYYQVDDSDTMAYAPRTSWTWEHARGDSMGIIHQWEGQIFAFSSRSYITTFQNGRAWVFIDTGSLSSDWASLYDTVKLRLYVTNWTGSSGADIIVTENKASKPVSHDHYDGNQWWTYDYGAQLGFETSGGFFDKSDWSGEGWYEAELNATGKGWINPGGFTAFCLRTVVDIGDSGMSLPIATSDAIYFRPWEYGDHSLAPQLVFSGQPLVEKYAPVLYLHEQEDFLPREITSMLNESDLRNGEAIPGPITTSSLTAHDEADYYLDMWEASPDHLCLEWPPLCADVPDPERFEEYPYVVYGREYDEHPDYIALQYWFFYPYNSWERSWEGTHYTGNHHEGDWEMITIILDKETGTPQWLSCAEHEGGDKYDWEDIELAGETHPKVFIAWGSHASYATLGDDGVWWPLRYIRPTLDNLLDVVSANGTALYPDKMDPSEIVGTEDESPYVLVDFSPVPNWVEWQGRWGERSIVPGGDGPESPGHQGIKWDDPAAWSESPRQSVTLCVTGSPVDIHAYDQYGNHVGLTETGETEAEIPGTYMYLPSDGDRELMWIYTEEDLRFEIVATGAGDFDFGVGRYIKSEDKEIVFTYEDIQITGNTIATLEVSPANPHFTMEVDLDGDGATDEYLEPDDVVVSGVNEPPIADANGPYEGEEGSPVTFTAENSADPNGDPLQFRWDFDSDGTWDTDWLIEPTVSYTWYDDRSGEVALKVWDGELVGTTTVMVNVSNVSPIVSEITAPLDPVELGTEISANATFSDPGTDDNHVAIWDWGDNSTSEGIVNETNGSGSVSGSHTYTAAGVYTIKLTVTDDDGGSAQSLFQYVVVYDPEGGFVTGGGWIDSPAGSYAADPALSGKAIFGFVSKYKKGATVPIGQTEFQLKVAALNFHSTSCQWLVIAGHKAMYKGTGTINGEGNYGFMLSAIDEELTPSTDVDLFRIKIWDKDNNEAIVYDNQMGDGDDADPTTGIEGGSIVIHTPK